MKVLDQLATEKVKKDYQPPEPQVASSGQVEASLRGFHRCKLSMDLDTPLLESLSVSAFKDDLPGEDRNTSFIGNPQPIVTIDNAYLGPR
ncbi:hypothetical protein FNV43_RR24663 [Rhamnella rubrinervis]|uniref:Uncharacterized protein n=1 Tax=Rhamnella rubrinervis TaxID=2594499 RepID=A0A8K0DRM2_9ROSA|nr:hypothetical protein FNV43_RR24663 [Rhamnella rubrinervis]